MMERFEFAIRYVLEQEDGKRWDHDSGCFTWNPGGHSDPPTKFGVVLDEYQGVFGTAAFPDGDSVRNATRDQALAVYRKRFWAPIQGDRYVSDDKATAILDTAVNKGLGGCKVILVDALHKPLSGEAWEYLSDLIGAVNSMPDDVFLSQMQRAVNNYITARIQRYPACAWAEKGWRARADRLPSLLTWSPQ